MAKSLVHKIVGVYAIRNLLTGRVYVGSSIDVVTRFATHRHELSRGIHRNGHLQHAWTLYGPDVFAFEILEEVAVDDRLAREQHYIDSIRDIYNLSRKAGCAMTPGRKHSDPTRSKMSAASKGRHKAPEHAAKLRAHMAVIRPSAIAAGTVDEVNLRRSATQKGRPFAPEHRQKISQAITNDPSTGRFVRRKESA